MDPLADMKVDDTFAAVVDNITPSTTSNIRSIGLEPSPEIMAGGATVLFSILLLVIQPNYIFTWDPEKKTRKLSMLRILIISLVGGALVYFLPNILCSS